MVVKNPHPAHSWMTQRTFWSTPGTVAAFSSWSNRSFRPFVLLRNLPIGRRYTPTLLQSKCSSFCQIPRIRNGFVGYIKIDSFSRVMRGIRVIRDQSFLRAYRPKRVPHLRRDPYQIVLGPPQFNFLNLAFRR